MATRGPHGTRVRALPCTHVVGDLQQPCEILHFCLFYKGLQFKCPFGALGKYVFVIVLMRFVFPMVDVCPRIPCIGKVFIGKDVAIKGECGTFWVCNLLGVELSGCETFWV